MVARDRRFQMIGGNDRPLGRLIEEFPGAADEALIPPDAVLLLHEQKRAVCIEPRVQSGGMKEHQGHEGVGTRGAETRLGAEQIAEPTRLLAKIGANG